MTIYYFPESTDVPRILKIGGVWYVQYDGADDVLYEKAIEFVSRLNMRRNRPDLLRRQAL